MAAAHSPGLSLPSPPPSGSRGPAAPAAPKLRDSCHACAFSKVKCHKEKPTCSRCAKRGLTCEYVATKRGGRKHDNQSVRSDSNNAPSTAASTINVARPSPPLSSWASHHSTVSGTDYLLSPGVIHAFPGPTTSGASCNVLQDLLSQGDQSLSSAPTVQTTDLDDFFTSPISFPGPDRSSIDILGQTDFTSVDSSSNSASALLDAFSLFEEAISELPSFSNSHSSSNSRASLTNDTQSFQGFRATDATPCCCLARALGLMRPLFLNPSSACTTFTPRTLDETATPPTIQTVIAQNEQTIEVVSAMLQCSCSQDSYLLAIMSIIVFKVLGWYAAAARKTPPGLAGDNSNNSSNDDGNSSSSPHTSQSPHSSHFEQVLQAPAVVGSYCLDGEDSARMAAQLVLSELHRVQRLVNQLSVKLKLQAAKNTPMAGTRSSSGCGDADGDAMSPFSTGMLDQLAGDLRKRLRVLSLEVVQGLRE